MTVRLLIVWALICAAVEASHAEPVDPQLKLYIERQLRLEGVPGAAIVVIRDRKIVWSAGFGIANTLTRERVTADTAFAAASNGKPIIAWLIVQLARRGTIDLRKPVLELAPVNLPHTPQHKRITPWHLLTHTSGLGNFLRDGSRDVAFEPGTRFAYSGVGFMVLQELLEAKVRRPLDAQARAELFARLGMTRTWYGERPVDAAQVAPPHVDLPYALAPFGIAAIPIFAALVLIAAAIARFRFGGWRIGKPTTIALAVLTIAIVVTIFHRLSGSWPLTIWFTAVPASTAASILVIATGAGFLAGGSGARQRASAGLAAVVLGAAVAAFGSARLPLPVDVGTANAASSLYASAPDLAKFLIELADPRLGETAATHQMTTAQRNVDTVAAWGLGIGVERHSRGRDLWQWGSNPGAKSLMIISPETGDGVVILTNDENASDLTRRIAARVLNREGCWRPSCAPE